MRGAIWLVARREIEVRTQSKAWRIGFLLTIVVIGVGAALPGLLRSDDATRYQIGIAGTDQSLRQALVDEGTRAGVVVDVTGIGDAAQASRDVESGDLDAAVFDGRVYAESATSAVVPIVQAAAAAVTTEEQLTAAGLSADAAARALSVQPLPLTTIDSDQDTARQVLATIIVVFFFAQLITFCTWVGTGVVEEKTSRVIEVLLGAVRPLHLLAGKVIGIGAVADDLAGSLDVPPSLYGTVALGFVWFVLGFAFFATLAAALASLVSHQEEVGGALTPVTVLLFVSYGASFYAAGSPDSTVAKLASFVPPFSALAMPGRTASSDVAPWEVGVAMLLMIAATAAVLLLGARLYRASILHTGKKMSLAAAWRSEPLVRG